MAEDIGVENGRISNFERLVTLTLDRIILHTVVHHSSTPTYMQNFTEIEETCCGRTEVRTHIRTYAHTHVRMYGRTYGRTDGLTFETGFIRALLSRLYRRVNLNKNVRPVILGRKW